MAVGEAEEEVRGLAPVETVTTLAAPVPQTFPRPVAGPRLVVVVTVVVRKTLALGRAVPATAADAPPPMGGVPRRPRGVGPALRPNVPPTSGEVHVFPRPVPALLGSVLAGTVGRGDGRVPIRAFLLALAPPLGGSPF